MNKMGNSFMVRVPNIFVCSNITRMAVGNTYRSRETVNQLSAAKRDLYFP